MEEIKLPDEKFVGMFTWRCRHCLKEWRQQIDAVPHGMDPGGCRACQLKDGDVEEFLCEECRWETDGV